MRPPTPRCCPPAPQGPRQAQWLAGRVLVQHLLRAAAPGQFRPLALPPLRNDPYGRPYFGGAGPQPAVSLSHAGAWVVALLAPPGTAAGLDVEAVREKALRIAPKFLNEAELAAAPAAGPHHRPRRPLHGPVERQGNAF